MDYLPLWLTPVGAGAGRELRPPAPPRQPGRHPQRSTSWPRLGSPGIRANGSTVVSTLARCFLSRRMPIKVARPWLASPMTRMARARKRKGGSWRTLAIEAIQGFPGHVLGKGVRQGIPHASQKGLGALGPQGGKAARGGSPHLKAGVFKEPA